MSRAARIIAVLRPATVVAAGAIAVHQLRYLVGYGSEASGALQEQGHAYLTGLLPILALLGGLTLLGTIVAGLAGADARRARRSPLVRALAYVAAILVVFGVQEIAEGVLVSAHPEGIAAIVSHGGLVAIPLAFALGSLAVFAVRGLEAVEERLAGGPARAGNSVARSALRPRPGGWVVPPPLLAAGAAPRAPPSL